MIDLNLILEGGNNMGSVSSIKVGDKVRITDVNVGFKAVDDNLGKVAEVVEVDQIDPIYPIKVKFLSGDWKGCRSWLRKEYFRVEGDANPSSKVSIKEGGGQGDMPLIKAANDSTYLAESVEEEVEEVEVGKIKEGDFVVIDTTHSEDSLLEGLHGKVVKVVEVDPTDTAIPIEVVLPNGYNRWMYPEEFYTAPTEGFNILVDEDKPKLYRDASGKEVPVLEVDYECGQGLFFKAMHNGELMWVHYMDCSVVQDTDVASELPKEAVEFDFTVMKSYTNGAVNTFLRIDKQSKHFYDTALLAEFNKAQASYLVCRSVAAPDYVEGGNLLYLRGIEDSGDSVEMLIPDNCLEQVVTTLVDLKAWMLNRCKQ